MRIISSIGFVLLIALGMTGCADAVSELQSKPNALGTTNEVVVISDQSLWDGVVGDTLMFYYASPYPIMPAPEPMFDVRHFTLEEITTEPLRKELRTYLIVADLGDTDSPTSQWVMQDLGPEKQRRFREDPEFFSSVGQDKWARGQILVYIFGRNEADLIDKIVESFPSVAQRVNKHDQKQIHAATYLNGEDMPLSQLIKDKFNVSLKIPGRFKVAINEENFIWIRQDDPDVTSSIAIRTFPYENKDQLELDGLINMRNRLGVLIQSTTVGSFMQTNAEDLPMLTYQKEIDGRYAVESRGIWEMTDDFLGGPFLNYAIVDGSRIVMIDCFVYAPGQDKRDYIQRLEHVISSVKFGSAG